MLKVRQFEDDALNPRVCPTTSSSKFRQTFSSQSTYKDSRCSSAFHAPVIPREPWWFGEKFKNATVAQFVRATSSGAYYDSVIRKVKPTYSPPRSATKSASQLTRTTSSDCVTVGVPDVLYIPRLADHDNPVPVTRSYAALWSEHRETPCTTRLTRKNGPKRHLKEYDFRKGTMFTKNRILKVGAIPDF
jgi:hypothetical protein